MPWNGPQFSLHGSYFIPWSEEKLEAQCCGPMDMAYQAPPPWVSEDAGGGLPFRYSEILTQEWLESRIGGQACGSRQGKPWSWRHFDKSLGHLQSNCKNSFIPLDRIVFPTKSAHGLRRVWSLTLLPSGPQPEAPAGLILFEEKSLEKNAKIKMSMLEKRSMTESVRKRKREDKPFECEFPKTEDKKDSKWSIQRNKENNKWKDKFSSKKIRSQRWHFIKKMNNKEGRNGMD